MEKVTHNCIIAVDINGGSVLLKSTPDLYEHDIFDGNDVADNISENRSDIPSVPGIYSCDILVKFLKYWTDCGYEYDMKTRIENVNLLLEI